jgi:hypothetical protein
VFGYLSDDVVDRATLSASASNRNLTVDNRSINFPWSSDKQQTQKLSFVVTVRNAKYTFLKTFLKTFELIMSENTIQKIQQDVGCLL